MQDLEIIYLVRDELLTYPQLKADEIYLIANIAESDQIMYNLLNKWMEQVDSEEKDYLYHDMLHRASQLVAKVLPFKRSS